MTIIEYIDLASNGNPSTAAFIVLVLWFSINFVFSLYERFVYGKTFQHNLYIDLAILAIFLFVAVIAQIGINKGV